MRTAYVSEFHTETSCSGLPTMKGELSTMMGGCEDEECAYGCAVEGEEEQEQEQEQVDGKHAPRWEMLSRLSHALIATCVAGVEASAAGRPCPQVLIQWDHGRDNSQDTFKVEVKHGDATLVAAWGLGGLESRRPTPMTACIARWELVEFLVRSGFAKPFDGSTGPIPKSLVPQPPAGTKDACIVHCPSCITVVVNRAERNESSYVTDVNH